MEGAVGQRRMEPGGVGMGLLCIAVLCSGAGEWGWGGRAGRGPGAPPYLWGWREEEEGVMRRQRCLLRGPLMLARPFCGVQGSGRLLRCLAWGWLVCVGRTGGVSGLPQH